MKLSIAGNKSKIGLICTLTASLLYGFTYVFIKSIIGKVSVLTLLSGRFTLAFLIMTVLILTGVLKINFKDKPIKWLFLIALFSPTLYFICETLAIKMTTASESATIIACIPIMIMILSTLINKEPPTNQQALSILGSVAGVIIIMLAKGISASFSPLGYLLLAGAVITDSMCAVLTRKYVEFTATERAYMMTFIGTVVFTTAASIEHIMAGTFTEFIRLPFTNMEFLVSILYLGGVCSVAASMLTRTAIAYIGPNRSSSFVGISAIASVLAGVGLLKEPFTFLQGVGTLLIITGVYAANSKTWKISRPIHSKERGEKT
jgi:drug/metabolite transporter (DMT)-like permease